MRIFSDFYQSDIVVASPLGLATKLGESPAEGDDITGGRADFLSSIEVAVVVRADVMTMQNWEHVKLGAADDSRRWLSLSNAHRRKRGQPLRHVRCAEDCCELPALSRRVDVAMADAPMSPVLQRLT